MQVQLTDSTIASATKKLTTGQRTELTDTRLPGLRLRITAAGKRAWVLGCRDADGRIPRFPLSDYPAMGISAARDAARAARMQVKAGADPIEAAREAPAHSGRQGRHRHAGGAAGPLWRDRGAATEVLAGQPRADRTRPVQAAAAAGHRADGGRHTGRH